MHLKEHQDIELAAEHSRRRVVTEESAEIDLRAYVGAVVKRRNTVAAILFCTMALAGAYSQLGPKSYEVSMIIEPPIQMITDTGIQNFDSVANIRGRIESGAYTAKIADELRIPERRLRFEISQPRDTRLVKVMLPEKAGDTETGRKALELLLDELEKGYTQIVQDKRILIDNGIKVTEDRIATGENDLKERSERLKLLSDREQQLLEDIKNAKVASEKLFAQREALLQQKSGDDISSILFMNAVQQDMAYFSQLENQLSQIRIDKNNLVADMDNLKMTNAESRIAIQNQDISKGIVQNISVVQEPLVSRQPIGPSTAEILLIGLVLGSGAGVGAVFLSELLENAQ